VGTDFGGRGEPVMLMSAPMVEYGQTCDEVGSGEKEMSNGRAVGSERRLKIGSVVRGVFGCMYPAWAKAGDKARAKSWAMTLCARFLLPRSQQKAWSPNSSCSLWPQMQGMLGGKIGSLSFRRRDKRKGSGVRRFLIGHLDIMIKGCDVVGESMLGRRWKCSGWCANMWLYSSALTMVATCFLRRLRAL